MTRRLLVTSGLPYANGPIHLGHMVEYLQSDIWARFQRLVGNEVLYVCADDTHGTPIMLRARSEGIDPEALIERMSVEHQRDFRDFGISFDHYGSTHSEDNRELTEEIFARLEEGGHVVEKGIEQAYCEKDGLFLPDRMVRGTCPNCGARDQYGDACESCSKTYRPTDLKDAECVLCGSAPTLRKSTHAFFRLSDFTDRLRAWISEGRVQAEVANKIEEWLGDELRDWDISRDAPYFGFPIPGRDGLYFYVWVDAPIGYVSATLGACREREIDFDAVWKRPGWEIHHFIGKDIIYFHTLFWPAMLMGAGFQPPARVQVHGFLTVNREKMSKSRGTFVNARTYLDHLDPIALRYYYACKMTPRLDDIDLNLDDFVDRVNSDLVGNVVNLVSRAGGTMLAKLDHRLGAMPPSGRELLGRLRAQKDAVAADYDGCDYAQAMRRIMALGDEANRLVAREEPWHAVKTDEEAARGTVTTALHAARVLATYLQPVVPQLTDKIARFLDVPLTWEGIDEDFEGKTLRPFERLLDRVDPKRIEAMTEQTRREAAEAADAPSGTAPATGPLADEPIEGTCTIDDFVKVDLRVARVVEADHVEGADKLLRLKLDLGGEERQVFAGIKAWYAPEELVGRLVACVANLAPRKMRFGTSEGMILAAGDKKRAFLVSPDEGAVPGQRIR